MSSENFFRTIWWLINIQEPPLTYLCKTLVEVNIEYLWVLIKDNVSFKYQFISAVFLWHFSQIVFTQLVIFSRCVCVNAHTHTDLLCVSSKAVLYKLLGLRILYTHLYIWMCACVGCHVHVLSPYRAFGRWSHRGSCHWVLCLWNSQIQTHLLWQLVRESASQRLPKWVQIGGID